MPNTIRLKGDVFVKAARLAGFSSDYGLAKAMDVNRSTVARVLAGELQPGPAFIGGALTALAPMGFVDLFEIVPVTPTSKSA
ncbi:transcriptional regulator [Actinosynnema sp. NPDC004786]